jgi:hypothetical protein
VESTDKNGHPMLLGPGTRQRLQQPPYDNWFVKNYDEYAVDSITATRLKPALTGKRFLIFMGTWCGDSRREVPRMFKILDCCGVDPSRIQLIMVSNLDRLYKQSPGHEEKGRDIRRVPDLIVLAGKKEIGRIVESPITSLEKDLLAIITRQNYIPNYAN